MKKLHLIGHVLVVGAVLCPAAVSAQDNLTNHLTFSARFGLNISAKFKALRASGGTPAQPRFTPKPDPYNYDDGYVLPDSSDSLDGQTWYWGYDDSSRQVSGNTILLSRSTAAANPSSPSFDSDPNYGAEVTYNHPLCVHGKMRIGVEVAVNYLNIALSDSGTFARRVNRVTDAYPFTPDTTPPEATPDDPYQGSFRGPGFTIGTTPVSSTTGVASSGSVADRRRLDADLWGWRLGPYLEIPVAERLNVSMSGGLAVGMLSSDASWTQITSFGGGLTSRASGSGRDHDLLVGGYLGANVSWQFAEHWSAVGGVQYQYLGTSQQTVGGRRVELDLSQSIFVTLGLGYNF